MSTEYNNINIARVVPKVHCFMRLGAMQTQISMISCLKYINYMLYVERIDKGIFITI